MSNPIERPCIVYMNDCRDCKDVTCIEEKVSGKERKIFGKLFTSGVSSPNRPKTLVTQSGSLLVAS